MGNFSTEDTKHLRPMNGKDRKNNDHSSLNTSDEWTSVKGVREWPVCDAVTFNYPIKAALSETGQWKYIVNNENYVQVVTGSICM